MNMNLQQVMMIGASPDPAHLPALIKQMSVEEDFFIRDMLTWALMRYPQDIVIPLLFAAVDEPQGPYSQSQALHTLSKIGESSIFTQLSSRAGLLHATDEETARTAWRTFAGLADSQESADLVVDKLSEQFGRGDIELQRSLSRAIVALAERFPSATERLVAFSDTARAHLEATRTLLDDPSSDFTADLDEALRIYNLGKPGS